MTGPVEQDPAGPAEVVRAGPLSLELPGSRLGVAWDALRGVYDPELYLDVVSLGLVYDVREEGENVVVEMTMTTPGCPASEILPEMARSAIVDGIEASGGARVPVDVRVVWDPPWSPAMIDEDAARALGFRSR